MFDRFIRLARAKRALHEGRYDEAARLADDPLIRDDRRAEAVRRAVQGELFRRGEERLRAGDASAARRDLQRVLAVGPHADASARLAEAEQRLQRASADDAAARRRLADARKAAEQGRLAEADRVLEEAPPDGALGPAVQALRAFVAGRRTAAGTHADRIAELLGAGRTDAAVAELRAARAVDADLQVACLPALVAAASRELEHDVAPLVEREPTAGAAIWRQRVGWLPELLADERVRALGDRLAAALAARLCAAEAPELELDLLLAATAEPPLPLRGETLRAAAVQLQRVPSLRTAGRSVELAAALDEAAQRLGSRSLAAAASTVRTGIAAAADRLEQARDRAAAGDLHGARTGLLAVLEDWPMHDEARSELDAVERGLRDRAQRVEAARDAAREGRLRAAYGMALAQATPDAAGDEARALARDLRARIDLVGRGLDQVRAAVHGRESGSAEALRHCVSRLDELAKVQSDHEELPALRAALVAEIEAVERWDAARRALAQQRPGEAANALHELVQSRALLLSAERLDARILALADQLVLVAQDALAGGRLEAVEQCAAGLRATAPLRADLLATLASLQDAVVARRDEAAAMVERARAALRERDLAAAEEQCEAARQLWVDGPHGKKLEAELRAIREQELALTRAASLADAGDVTGAHARLDEMPPTPPMLRTRIFDLKQTLAKKQGLEGGFLLRVDEGGEFLVLRGETITIGNVREGRADLPILAAIAGLHAHVRRSMSFHGGMQDTIVAQHGEVRVGGARVEQHVLRSGDRVQLGSALMLHYVVPSSRSLSVSLQLVGGFQVAGTDRVLLLKDRGRDGRLLLGTGQDVHVRVPGATGEVEVFANKSGQLRVRCEAGGTIDGRPFRGDHPVDAGAMVQAAGITFVLLPWQRR